MKLIKILLEEIESHLHEWRKNLQWFNNYYSTAIYSDNETGNILYLLVGFTDSTQNTNYKEFAYSFILYDKNQKPITDFITSPTEASKHIEQTDKKLIFTIIMDLTRKLLDRTLPKKIIRRSAEVLNEKQILRYQKITDIMVNEYGYEVVQERIDELGHTEWLLQRQNVNEMNEDMDEFYFIKNQPSKQEVVNEMFKTFKPYPVKK
jgi:hypothetical protein